MTPATEAEQAMDRMVSQLDILQSRLTDLEEALTSLESVLTVANPGLTVAVTPSDAPVILMYCILIPVLLAFHFYLNRRRAAK